MTEGPDGWIYFTTSQFDPPEGTPRPEYDFILRLVPQTVPSTGAKLAAEWNGPRPQETTLEPGTTNASQIVAAYCAPCHGPGLRGGMQRGLLYGHWQFAKDDEAMRNVITRGLAEKGMSAFGAALTPAQVSALIAYIRANQTNAPEPAPLAAPKFPGQPSAFE